QKAQHVIGAFLGGDHPQLHHGVILAQMSRPTTQARERGSISLIRLIGSSMHPSADLLFTRWHMTARCFDEN
ncbi:hypothetical protein NL358_28335, partial [Klebsiella pneumoniae]|nr:hypothetical protein [Klebsiella pneumoniae]